MCISLCCSHMRPQETSYFFAYPHSSYVRKFKQASMVTVCKDICRGELVLLLEGVSPGWWDKEVH